MESTTASSATDDWSDKQASPFDMNAKRASLVFWTVAIVYGIFWTIYPWHLEENYRFDVIEMFFIGREGVVSTFKHPALNSALLEIVYQSLGRSSITPFLLSQVCFFCTAFILWRFSRELLSPMLALISVLTFYGYWGYFYKSLYYNHNVILFPVWAFMIMTAYWALKKGRYRDWILLGVAIGIGAHCKYTILVLVASILFFMVWSRSSRKYFLTPGPYLTTLLSMMIAIPQIIWIIQSDFSCLRFPELEYGLEKTFANRCYALCNDALLSFPVLISSFLFLLVPLLGFRWRLRSLDDEHRFARNFLFAVTVGPFALQALTVFWKAIPMEFGNFMQLYLFAGLLLLLSFETKKTVYALKLFVGFFAFVMIGYVVSYSVQNYSAHHWTSRIVRHAFPGRMLAEKAEKIWHEHYEKPIPYVVGGWWYAGNVAVYSNDRPSVHSKNDPGDLDDETLLSNWSTDEDVLKYGGLVFWEDGIYKNPQKTLGQRFPTIEVLEPILLSPDSEKIKKSIRVGVGIVPPNTSMQTKPFQPKPWRYYNPKKNSDG